MFSRITPVTAGAFLALAALIVGFAAAQGTVLAATPTPTPTAPPPAPFRAEMACAPLTSSQSAQVGDSQRCRIRLRNNSDETITGITYSRPTPNTLTARFPLKASYGITCTLAGCDPFTLAPGASVIIIETSTFNPTQDGRGKTTVTATGTLNGATVTASGTEQFTLP